MLDIWKDLHDLKPPVSYDEVVNTPEGRGALLSGYLKGSSARRFGGPTVPEFKSELFQKTEKREDPTDPFQGALDRLEVLGYRRGLQGKKTSQG